MLKLYNKEHVAISALTNLKDYKIEYLLSGEDLVEFSLSICDENINLVEEEGYVRSKNNEYVIKAIDPSDNFKRFSCNVNVESLVGKSIANFDTSNNNITDTIRLAIAGTGWILADNNITKRRTVRLKNTNALEVLREIREVFRVDFRFDAINKKIYVYEPFGEDRGVYFSDELNLRSLSIPSDTYEYATRLFAYGKDGLNISSINNGKEYVENYQYSNKIIELIWEDNRYTDINSLKADAEAKLEELSKPKRSYQADVSDLAKLNDEYSYLDFGIGDTITLLSKSEKFRDKQRIVKYIEYPNNPSMNTCELGNTTLTFEDLQKENENKNNTVDNITSDNGTVDGSKVDSITTEQISNFKASVAEITDLTVINADITNLKAQNVTITGELNAVKANIGTLTVNVATIDKLTVTHTANINELNSNKASITQLNAVSATINTLEVDVGKIQTLVNGNLSSENIQAGGITSDKLTIANGFITNAMIANLDVSKVNAGVISTEKFQIKSSDGSMEFIGSTQQFKDKNNKVRIQLGKDTQGNFNFIIRGEDGTTTLIDHTGVKANALADNLIVSNMIGIDAVGEKQINYSSFATGFNKDTNTSTIKSTKIMLNNQNQSLEVAFNSLKTQADGTKTTTESNSTTISVMQGQISTAINNTQIVKDGQTILLKDDYNRTVSIVNSMNSTIGSHTTKIDANTGKITGVETKTNELERTLNSVSSRLTSTETTVTTHTTNITKAQTDATKGINDAKIAKTQADKGVSDAKGALDKANLVDGKVTTLNTTVTTTNTKVSAMEQNLNSITQRVASTESTTTTLTTKVNTAQSTADSAKSTASSANSKIDGLEVGGRNLFVGNRFSVYANYNRLTAQDGSKEVISTWNDTDTGIIFTLSNSGYTPKGTYTLSGFLKVNDSIPKTKYFTSRASTYGDNLQENFYDPKTGYFRIVQDYMGNSIWILHGPTTRTSGSSDMVVLSNLKFEKGNKATDWTPAPEDVQNQIDTHTTEITSTKSKVATIETNLTSITSRVGTVETKQTTTDGKVTSLETWKKSAEVKITDSSIVSTVTNSSSYRNDLNGKVSSASIISSINQTAEAIKISASKLELSGYVTISNLQDGSTVISGSNIKTGTITAVNLRACDIRGKSMIYIQENGVLSCDGQTYIRDFFVPETHPGWAPGSRGSFKVTPTGYFDKDLWIANEVYSKGKGVILRETGVAIQIANMGIQQSGSGHYLLVNGYQSNHSFGVDLWYSDVKLKTNIQEIDKKNNLAKSYSTISNKTGLELINALKHYKFNYKSNLNNTIECGYIAQDLQEHNNQLVEEIRQQDGTTLLQPKISTIVPNLSLAIQEQSYKIKYLESLIKQQSEEIKKLRLIS